MSVNFDIEQQIGHISSRYLQSVKQHDMDKAKRIVSDMIIDDFAFVFFFFLLLLFMH